MWYINQQNCSQTTNRANLMTLTNVSGQPDHSRRLRDQQQCLFTRLGLEVGAQQLVA